MSTRSQRGASARLAVSRALAPVPFDQRAMAAIEGRNWIDWRGRNYGRPVSRQQRATGTLAETGE